MAADVLVLDFTSNQDVYERHGLPKGLLRWRVLVDQPIQLLLPTFSIGDTWRIARIKKSGGGFLSEAEDSNLLCADFDGDVRKLEGKPVSARGGREFPALSFKFLALGTGRAVIELVHSNALRKGSLKRYDLELTITTR